jgi:hypothetical protein
MKEMVMEMRRVFVKGLVKALVRFELDLSWFC